MKGSRPVATLGQFADSHIYVVGGVALEVPVLLGYENAGVGIDKFTGKNSNGC